eukprot:6550406-Pyramimonas_sp.AAC.1
MAARIIAHRARGQPARDQRPQHRETRPPACQPALAPRANPKTFGAAFASETPRRPMTHNECARVAR